MSKPILGYMFGKPITDPAVYEEAARSNLLLPVGTLLPPVKQATAPPRCAYCGCARGTNGGRSCEGCGAPF